MLRSAAPPASNVKQHLKKAANTRRAELVTPLRQVATTTCNDLNTSKACLGGHILPCDGRCRGRRAFGALLPRATCSSTQHLKKQQIHGAPSSLHVTAQAGRNHHLQRLEHFQSMPWRAHPFMRWKVSWPLSLRSAAPPRGRATCSSTLKSSKYTVRRPRYCSGGSQPPLATT